MAKKIVPRRTKTIQNVIKENKGLLRRTKTMQQTLDANKNINLVGLGRTRSQSRPTHPHLVANVVPVKKEIKKPNKKILVVKQAEDAKKIEKKIVAQAKVEKKQIKKPVIPKKSPNKVEQKKKASPKKDTAPSTSDLKKSSINEKSIVIEKVPVLQQNEVRKTQSRASQGIRRADSRATAGIVDVVFCLDTTSSMSSYINQSKEAVKTIVKNIKEKSQSEEISVRFGMVCYRDHPPEDNTYVTKIKDLCTDDEILEFINQQNAQGGGDYPEAVLDGLLVAAKGITWRDSRKVPSLRYIFHIADAPPHGSEFGHESRWSKGVPSQITLDQVIHAINIREIHYRLINLRPPQLQKMVELFKKNFTNYDETTLDHAQELNIKISDMIIHELLPDIDYAD